MTRRQQPKAWNKFRLGRNTGVRGEPKKRILIVCEGEKTEPNYFKAFRVTSAVVIVKGLGTHTIDIVKTTIQLKQKAIQDDISYDQVWCVFDRDSFSATDFKNAILLAHQNDIKVAYSNEAFEVWYLLHFSYFHTGVPRNLYVRKLSRCLRREYKKNSKIMYEEILPKQAQAIKNARKLIESYQNHKPELDNPSTSVFKLVEELNKNL